MYRILLHVLLSFSLIAQAQTGNYSIGGIVLNAESGEPIKNAMVTLNALPAPRTNGADRPPNAPVSPRMTFSGPGGDFLFNGLAEGGYSLSAQKPGFVPEQHPAGMPILPDRIELNSSVNDVRVRLSPLGVIEGKAVDQYGDPVRGVNIMALRVRVNDGMRVTTSSRSVTTDDRGVYRLWNLDPGTYYIKAAGFSGGTYTYVADSAPTTVFHESFVPIYSGGALVLSSATPITIAPGTQARADLSLKLEPGFKIRGLLKNVVPTQAVKFELFRDEEDVGASGRVNLNTATGQFEMVDIVPGAYTLRAMQGETALGETTFTVKGSDVNDMDLALSPGVTVTARVQTLGPPSPALPPNFPGRDQVIIPRGIEGLNAFCNVTLARKGSGLTLPKYFKGNPAGDLSVDQVLPGQYRLDLRCTNGYVTSAMAGSTDLLTNPWFKVQPGVVLPRIEIAVMNGGCTLTGKLDLNPMPANPGVLLVPAFTASTGPMVLPLFPLSGAQKDPTFYVPNLAPGDYTVYVFSQWGDVEFRNPAFLQSLSSGITVRMEEGNSKEITLTSVVK